MYVGVWVQDQTVFEVAFYYWCKGSMITYSSQYVCIGRNETGLSSPCQPVTVVDSSHKVADL